MVTRRVKSMVKKMRFLRKNDKCKTVDEPNRISVHGKLPGFGVGSGYQNFGSPPAGARNRRPDTWADDEQQLPRATARSATLIETLPAPMLERVFVFVCPHTQDETYETCEQSSLEDACTLCDLRDLAHCVAVCRRWRKEARQLLYHSIRIDSVHYCEREIYLSDRRKRKTLDRNAEPEDTAQARLRLLCRTLRDEPTRLGRLVQFLKIPYMLRESAQADIARTVAVLRNLKYVDLPEGMFADGGPYQALRLEIQAACHGLRKMTYMSGSERRLQALAGGTVWPKLEVLELNGINMDYATLRQVLGASSNLRALKVSGMNMVTDELFASSDVLPPFPPLEQFILSEAPFLTALGLKAWLHRAEARQALKVLSLKETGVKLWALPEILAALPALQHFSILEAVSAAMPVAAGTRLVQPISSPSIEVLHFEVTLAASAPKLLGTTRSYYSYLASSLLSGGLPKLRMLYVREPVFPDMLLGLPWPASVEDGIRRPRSSGHGTGNSSRLLSVPSGPVSPAGFLAPPGASDAHRTAAPPLPWLSAASAGGRPVSATTTNPFPSARLSDASLPGLKECPGLVPQPSSSNNPYAGLVSDMNNTHLSPASNSSVHGACGSIANLPARLEVYTKGEDELNWSFVKVDPATAYVRRAGPHCRHFSANSSIAGGGERPRSSYGLGTDIAGPGSGWTSGAGARKSVFIGHGAGGFVAVQDDDAGDSDGNGGHEPWPRPRSSAGQMNNKMYLRR